VSGGESSLLRDSFSHEPLSRWFTFLCLRAEIRKKEGKKILREVSPKRLRGQSGSCERNFSSNSAPHRDRSHRHVTGTHQAQLTRFTSERETLHRGSLQSRKLRHCSKPSSLRFVFAEAPPDTLVDSLQGVERPLWSTLSFVPRPFVLRLPPTCVFAVR